MKIQSLSISNFKGARRVDIHSADSTVNELAGENEAGKTSVLDAIVALLRGARHIQDRPLTIGASRGDIVGEVVEDKGITLDLKRTFTEKNQYRGGSLKVTASDGSKWGQTELNTLFGDFTFDPLAVSRMSGRDRIEALRKLAGDDYCQRHARRVEAEQAAVEDRKEQKAALKLFGTIPNLEDPGELIDSADVMEQLAQWDAHDEQIYRWRERINELERRRSEARAGEERAMMTIREARAVLENAERSHQRAYDARVKADETPDPPRPADPDVPFKSDLQDKLTTAAAHNAAVHAYTVAEDKRAAKRTHEKKLAAAERQIARVRTDIIDLQKSIELPVDGLTWEGDDIALDGVPFEQLSSSRQLRLSALIGMTVNAKLRIMFIKDGSLLSPKSYGEISELAEERGYQLWIETVGDGHGKDAMVIVEGEFDSSFDEDGAL